MKQRQEQANQAAEQFADAVKGSYRAVADRGEAVQQHNAQLTQQFFNGVINNLRTQAEDNRQMTQELAGQQRRTQEAGQMLMQESAGAYMDLVNSMFSFYQGSVRASAEQAERRRLEQAGGGAGQADGDLREELRGIIRESVKRSQEGS